MTVYPGICVCVLPKKVSANIVRYQVKYGTRESTCMYVHPTVHARGKKKKWQKQKRKKDAKLKKSKRGGKNKEGLDRRGPRVQSKVMYEQTSFEHNIIQPHHHVCTVCSIPPCR